MSEQWARTWPEYVRKRSGGQTPKQVEDRTGISASTVRRWFAGEDFSQPSSETAAAFARGYHPGRLGDALIAAGRARREDIDVNVVETAISLRDVPDGELVQEISDRLSAYRNLLAGDNAQDWPAGWGSEHPGVGGVQDSD